MTQAHTCIAVGNLSQVVTTTTFICYIMSLPFTFGLQTPVFPPPYTMANTHPHSLQSPPLEITSSALLVISEAFYLFIVISTTPPIPKFRHLKQGYQEFEVILGYITSSGPAWAT